MSKKYITILFLFSVIKALGQDFKDCINPFPVCNKQTYTFGEMRGFGNVFDALGKLRCSNELKETNSVWLKWKISKPGNLIFFISPLNDGDDLDFVVFRSGDSSCNNLTEVRCMASGDNVGSLEIRNSYCQGATGLSYQSQDDFERNGCLSNHDNFLKYIETQKDEYYFLFVNNYSHYSGFSISFDGDTEFAEFDDCMSFVKESEVQVKEIGPIPATDILSIYLSSKSSGSMKLDMFSIDGKLISNYEYNLKPGENNFQIKVDYLTPGNYILRFNQDGDSFVRQFVKI